MMPKGWMLYLVKRTSGGWLWKGRISNQGLGPISSQSSVFQSFVLSNKKKLAYRIHSSRLNWFSFENLVESYSTAPSN